MCNICGGQKPKYHSFGGSEMGQTYENYATSLEKNAFYQINMLVQKKTKKNIQKRANVNKSKKKKKYFKNN